MKLDVIVAWYQKKIGTYDKQQWEKTVEQKILSGFTRVPLKNTKLKTELIDVDLVRGSSFPKAKPKQSLITVLRFACLRLLFLPVYAKWWVNQTTPKIFLFLLVLYLLQMLNWAIYCYNTNRLNGTETEHIVSVSELLIPMTLSLILSGIHSHIVATASSSVGGDNRNRLIQPKLKRRDPKRRRKKSMKLRSNFGNENKVPLNEPKNLKRTDPLATPKKVPVDDEFNRSDFKFNGVENVTEDNSLNANKSSTNGLRKRVKSLPKSILNATVNDASTSGFHESPEWNNANNRSKTVTIKDPQNELVFSPPVKVEQPVGTAKNPRRLVQRVQPAVTTGEDDGFESLNGKSASSGEENQNLINNQVDGNLATEQNDIEIRNEIEANKVLNLSLNKTSTPIHQLKNNMKPPSPRFASPSSESEMDAWLSLNQLSNLKKRQDAHYSKKSDKDSSGETDEEGENDGEIETSSLQTGQYTEATTSATEWIGITTNSEECSYSSEMDDSSTHKENSDYEFAPTVILNSSSGTTDRINCTIWDGRETKKAEMTVLDISSAIIERVEGMPETCDYIYIGLVLSIILSLVPAFCRLCDVTVNETNSTEINFLEMPQILLEKASFSLKTILDYAFGETWWERTVLLLGFILRICLTFIFFFLLAVAERTFKQRFLYAKLFSHLTSSRRAKKSELPHFRLNKVRNIKTWLSVRSYLKRRGPQRSVDVIVSTTFLITLLLLAFLSVEWLKDSVHLHSQFNLEALIWSCALGTFLLRFMTLGTKINKKYRSISVLITEQINLYLQIEQIGQSERKPQKKEELMVANSVLKLAADLLKELESPFKISGLSANPYLYTTVKVVILSALSGVLSEMLGFKLKLHKIKIK